VVLIDRKAPIRQVALPESYIHQVKEEEEKEGRMRRRRRGEGIEAVEERKEKEEEKEKGKGGGQRMANAPNINNSTQNQ